MDKKLSFGILYVLGGAVSYGVLATIVKVAYSQGFTTAEITLSQYLPGVLFFGMLLLKSPGTRRASSIKGNPRQYLTLMIGGTTFGITGLCYYYSVLYLPVSVCVILLMQSIWMGVLIESLLAKRFPSKEKLLACSIIWIGTILATNVIEKIDYWEPIGVLWGLLAAVSYAVAMTSVSKVATNLKTVERSFYMMLGALIVVVLLVVPSLLTKFDLSIFWTWGLILALFGTILPPLLFNAGMPATGIGLGSILISVEIPVSIGLAYFVLNETIKPLQWLGVLMIITAIVVLNYRLLKPDNMSFSSSKKV